MAQAPGAQTDVLARLLGDRLTELWKAPAVVEYHGGAGGTIGADLVAKAPADGYTVLIGGLNNLAVAAALVKDLRYDPSRDFAPVGGMARVPYALAVNRRVPATTLPELIAYAQAHPGRLTYGSGGNGSMSSLGAELLKSMAGLDIVHVPYRGSAPSIQAPEIAPRLEQLGYEPMLDTPAQFGALIRTETEKYTSLIKRAGIRGEP